LELYEVADSTENADAMRAEIEKKIDECRGRSLKNFEEIIRINPQDKDALKRLGIIYLLNQQNREAVVALQDHVAIDSSDVDVLDFLGRAYINLGEMKLAIRPYELLVANDPGSIDAWERLAELYKYNDMPEKAKEAETTAADLKKL
jgi:Tfp pilus assembly protein PilF